MGFLNTYELSLIKGEIFSKDNIKVEEVKPKRRIYRKADPSRITVINRQFETERYEFFEGCDSDFKRSLNFYDFEVFQYDWLVVIINPFERTRTLIANDVKALTDYYSEHSNQIWVGYNSHTYDRYILKGIISGMNPKKISDSLIIDGMYGWQISDEFRNIPLYDFDVMNPNEGGLKTLESYMGNDIKETTIPFDIDRVLTSREIRETFSYCNHDVEQTMKVFEYRINEYNSQVDLLKTFRLPVKCISLTKAQLTAQILECEQVERHDEFNLKFVDTIVLNRYGYIMDWFKNVNNRDYSRSLETNVCGVPHNFGWGGLHGCPKEAGHYKGKIFHCDVTSFYPSLMIEYDFLTRNCRHKEKFKEIYDKRVALKKAGKKKEQAPFKIVLNSTYGILKQKMSKAHDSRQANCVCVNGQLLLLDLLEKLEPYIVLINSNTDGIIIMLKEDRYEDRVRSVCAEWSKRTRMGLGIDEITEMWQTPDVNSYIFRFANGKLEKKGAYVKDLSELDNNLSIVNYAMVNYITNGTSVEDTIFGCDELIMYQIVVKVSSKYAYGWHNGERLNDKTFRVFASNDVSDTYIGRTKSENGTIAKFADTPDRCFIENGDIKGLKVPSKLNKRWYINLAKERLSAKFGIDTCSNRLF